MQWSLTRWEREQAQYAAASHPHILQFAQYFCSDVVSIIKGSWIIHFGFFPLWHSVCHFFHSFQRLILLWHLLVSVSINFGKSKSVAIRKSLVICQAWAAKQQQWSLVLLFLGWDQKLVVTAAAFTPDGTVFVSVSIDGSVFFFHAVNSFKPLGYIVCSSCAHILP